MNRFILSFCFAIIAVIFIPGCSQPLTDSVALSGQELERGLVGYNKTLYVYPIQVPSENRWVELTTEQPLNYWPTYEDYLEWKATGEIPAGAAKHDAHARE